VRRDGSRQLLRTQGESQADWEALQNLYRHGLEGKNLLLIVTDDCAGLAAAIQTVYPVILKPRLMNWRTCAPEECSLDSCVVYLR